MKSMRVPRIISLIIFLINFSSSFVFAQVENVIVEKYYISDVADATDTTGGGLPAGSVTYRIFVDLAPGAVLKKIYADGNHPVRFTSTHNFYNNLADGKSFGYEFSKTRLSENLVALDSWLTLGQTTRVSAMTTYGVLKSQDDDGSFIGGVNNDGGSAGIPSGLIANQDPIAGIPVTVADGMDTMSAVPASWLSYGIQDPVMGDDSTIFGSLVAGNEFISYNFGLQNSGVTGVDPDSNQVLVAQLTTLGQLSFELNVVVEEPAVPLPKLVKYVARLADGELNSDTLKVAPFLTYPPVCGCTDPGFLEYSSAFACGIYDSCKTLIVFGCMDSIACNYDPDANYNVVDLCCYPGRCNDRDIALVCPALNFGKKRPLDISLYPNPVVDELNVVFDSDMPTAMKLEVMNQIGEHVFSQNIGSASGRGEYQINVSNWPEGIYLMHVVTPLSVESLRFIKY